MARISAFSEIPPSERRRVRAAVYQIDELIKLRLRSQPVDARQRLRLQQNRALLLPVIQYVPAWVRLLSAACLGLDTMIGYRRIVHTLGERIGTMPLTPAQGACTELAGAGLITLAARFGLPVSTTHIVASGIAGTMISQGDQVQNGILRQIALAWLLTLPATLVLAACLFYGLS